MLTGPLWAQSITWRIPEYGSGAAVAGTPPKALAFDAGGNVYTLAYTADAFGDGLRLLHYQSSAGGVLWQRDFASLLGSIAWGFPTAALASAGDDAALIMTDYDTHLFARVARVRGSDGAILWQHEEHGVDELVLHAAASDTAGNIVAAGTSGPYNGPLLGQVAKFRGSDGERLWSVAVDPSVCGVAAPISFHFADVATDSHDDVLVVGVSLSDPAVAFCAFKLDGSSGAALWWYGQPRGGAGVGMPHIVVDSQGNAVVGNPYGGAPSALVKLNGATGGALWSKQSLPSNTLFALDSSGNVIVSADVTRAYAAADGHVLWPQDSPLAGSPVVSGGTIVLASSDSANSRLRFAGLDVQDGSPLWSSDFDVGTTDYWNALAVAADQNGHFAALQADTLCCAHQQLLTVAGESASGEINWHASDPLTAASQALLVEPDPYLNRTSALTADGAMITVGEAYPGFQIGTYPGYDARVLVSKRSVHDGHRIWTRTVEAGLNYCRPSQLVLDANGDAVVAATCSGVPQTIKVHGSDGSIAWTGASMEGCDYASAQSVATDASNDVYSTGTCASGGNFAGQFTVKYDGSTGAKKWEQVTAATSSSYSQFLAAPSADGVVIGGLLNRSGNPDAQASSLVIRKLHAADGTPAWSHYLDPPVGGFYELRSLATYTNGDVAVAGVGSSDGARIARLKALDGTEKWAIADAEVAPISLSIDNVGNVVVAGNSVAKYAAASGARQWLFPQAFNDLTFDATGNILATGTCVEAMVHTKLCVVAINASNGTQLWQAVDPMNPTSLDFGTGVLSATDGSILVSAQFALPGASPWTLVRFAGPSTDGLFANGFEP